MSFISRMFLKLQVNLTLNAIMQAAGILGRCKEIIEDDELCSLYFMAHSCDERSSKVVGFALVCTLLAKTSAVEF